MKAFRNTGIEGGYGSLRTQNWLLGMRRSIQRSSKLTGEKASVHHATRRVDNPPAKAFKSPFPKGTHTARLTASLLRYLEKPGNYGSWASTKRLIEAQMIKEVAKPTYSFSAGPGKPLYWIGGVYQITAKGREYVRSLTAPVVREQINSKTQQHTERA